MVGRLRELPVEHPARLRAERVAEAFVREGRHRRRKTRRAELAAVDGAVDATLTAATVTGDLARREDAPLALPAVPEPVGEFRRPRRCYVCKASYRQVDSFYHALCPDCARDNAARRALSTDLRGRRALLTGGRVKIGFQLALMMLRDGVELIVTSRFPHDTVRRFQAAPGSAGWLDRLTVVGIDLRDPRQVLGLCESLRAEGRPLDILVNNAAQTLRRPPGSYALLAAGEHAPLPPGTDARRAVAVSHAPGFRPMPALTAAWPAAELGPGGPAGEVAPAVDAPDEAGLLPDTAAENSWTARLGTLDPAEVLETQLVNALAPALPCDRLLPLLLAAPHPNRYIVNVTAVEGRFTVRNKTAGHPHTNMAKAALNMLTRTSAAELAAQGVHMCAVDTGWITDENPAPKKARIAARGIRTPLDIVDGAARVYDPIVRGEAGDPVAGVFLKDYREAAW
ncbi:SDR family NAD(P)-dependent oxidoreductase [Kitasatospora mediocidica]|uniref:SDR family NAD(P)-dependent oxidoreductase n=1 Tax=Kitasatospora mediocidica TaxID=58352 RepID=UPI00068BA4BB|nr:SDR family NAD(P)-dependent oxidoreductase [Kitasatospora mediocidica]